MSSENTDKGLEMIQAKLDEHKFAFDEQMWTDMEEKLDKEAGVLSKWGKKLSILLFLSPIRLSAILLFTAGTIYFFIKPTAGDNILSENTITTISSSQETTNTKAKNTFSTKEENTSKSHTLNTHSAQIIDASKFKNKIQKNAKINQQAISNSKKVAKLKVSNKITTLEAYSTPKTEKQILVENEVKNTNETIFSYAQDSPSTIALAVEEIPSKKIAALLPFEEVPEFDKPIFPKKSKWHWGVTGGLLVKKTPFANTLDKVEDKYIGIRANRKFNNKWSLGFVMTLKKLNLAEGIKLSFTDTLITPVGFSAAQISKQINKFTFLESSIYLQYKLPGSRSFFKLGIRPSFILTESNNNTSLPFLGTYVNNSYPRSTIDEVETIIRQPFYGTRRFNLGILLGYEYRINHSWSINLDFAQGLSDISKNRIYSNNKLHRNTDLQLGVTYWIRE